jgi:hypothetical protein
MDKYKFLKGSLDPKFFYNNHLRICQLHVADVR